MTRKKFIKNLMATPIPQYLDFITWHNQPFIQISDTYSTISRNEAIAIADYVNKKGLKYEDTKVEPHQKVYADGYYIQINNPNLPNGYTIFGEEPIAYFNTNKTLTFTATLK